MQQFALYECGAKYEQRGIEIDLLCDNDLGNLSVCAPPAGDVCRQVGSSACTGTEARCCLHAILYSP